VIGVYLAPFPKGKLRKEKTPFSWLKNGGLINKNY